MGKHTPGPWAYESSVWLKSMPGYIKETTTGCTIADVYDDYDLQIISAAPEMLEACKAALKSIRGTEHPDFLVSVQDAGDCLEAAIAKAEGRC